MSGDVGSALPAPEGIPVSVVGHTLVDVCLVGLAKDAGREVTAQAVVGGVVARTQVDRHVGEWSVSDTHVEVCVAVTSETSDGVEDGRGSHVVGAVGGVQLLFPVSDLEV